MNMKNYLNQLIAFLFAASALLATFSVQANDAASGKEAVIVLQKRTLPDAPGKKVIVAIVNYAPGAGILRPCPPWICGCLRARRRSGLPGQGRGACHVQNRGFMVRVAQDTPCRIQKRQQYGTRQAPGMDAFQ